MRVRPIVLHRGRKIRVVYAVSKRTRRRLRRLARRLAAIERHYAALLGVPAVAHGFVYGRSPVTMALAHRGYALTVSCDLSGWFDSVRAKQVKRALMAGGMPPVQAGRTTDRICIRGVPPSPRHDQRAPRQGLSTSPVAANLAAVVMDRAILDALRALPCRTVYTRYADDMVVSASDDSRATADAIVDILRRCAEAQGWAISDRKTCIQRASAGRRRVVGISVGADDVRIPRRVRRKLRAALHSAPQSRSAEGLRLWCACSLPRAARPSRQVQGRIVGGDAPPGVGPGRRIAPPPSEQQTHTAAPPPPGRRIVRGEGQ